MTDAQQREAASQFICRWKKSTAPPLPKCFRFFFLSNYSFEEYFLSLSGFAITYNPWILHNRSEASRICRFTSLIHETFIRTP